MVKSKRLMGALVLGGVFLLGALTGAAGMYARDVRHQAEMVGPGRLAQRRHGFVRRLGLSAEQSRQVDAIFQRHEAEMEQVRQRMLNDCGAPMREHAERIDAEIRALLDADQQRRFDRLRAERRRRGLVGLGPPDGPPPGRGEPAEAPAPPAAAGSP